MYDYKNKEGNIKKQIDYMFARSINMFEYSNLPDTLPADEIERLIQRNGSGFIAEYENELYIFNGSYGGNKNVYGRSTTYIISNAYINYNAELTIGLDGVLIRNDDLELGLQPIYERYITMMIENEISMVMDSYNNRIQTLISAGDDTTKESADQYIKNIIKGELGIIGENRIFEGVKVNNTRGNTNSIITSLVEYHQYLKASLYNEIGLNANFNMKRERLSSSETNLNVEGLYPFIDDMLECRQQAMDQVNDLFGTNIQVDFNGVWKRRKHDETEVAVDPEEVVVDPEEVAVDPEEVVVDPEDPEDPEDPKDPEEVLIDVIIEELEDLKDEI